jgi:hypothetical protein
MTDRGFKILLLKYVNHSEKSSFLGHETCFKPVFLFSPLTNERIVDMNVVALICALQSTWIMW